MPPLLHPQRIRKVRYRSPGGTAYGELSCCADPAGRSWGVGSGATSLAPLPGPEWHLPRTALPQGCGLNIHPSGSKSSWRDLNQVLSIPGKSSLSLQGERIQRPWSCPQCFCRCALLMLRGIWTPVRGFHGNKLRGNYDVLRRLETPSRDGRERMGRGCPFGRP